MTPAPARPRWRQRLHEIVFEADTRLGRGFDVAVMTLILVSVAAVVLESVDSVRVTWGRELYWLEWVITVLFTLEYVLRLVAVDRPIAYARSFYGVVDLLSVLPTYLSLLFPGAQSLLVIRSLRLLRIFRVFKMGHFVGEANMLSGALHASSRKITVFLVTVLTLVLIIGATMYLVEGPKHGFTSIPISIYWAIVTMTTVGYGDLAPQTVLGKLLASMVMIAGYGIIAVPTGIVTAELTRDLRRPVTSQACPVCTAYGHDTDARHCKYCGAHL